MINEQLVSMSRAIVTAVRGAEFEPEQLRNLFLTVVPELLAEIEILGLVTSDLLPEPEDVDEDKEPKSRNARRRRKRRSKR